MPGLVRDVVTGGFRDRLVRAGLVRAGLVRQALGALLDRLVEQGHLKADGRARTDSTHVLGVIRHLNRLELGLAALERVAGHPDRDAQFGYLHEQVAAFQAAGDPVISGDAKKKELVRNFANSGVERRRVRRRVDP